ncbi:MAG: SEC-C domain-containing protein [Desulforhopalus sp.]|nr:SEC-C domain-containing protein [Desulforhopalus sp.]
MKKIPRNAQCPCGSGKKFKRCHGLIGNVEIPSIKKVDNPKTLLELKLVPKSYSLVFDSKLKATYSKIINRILQEEKVASVLGWDNEKKNSFSSKLIDKCSKSCNPFLVVHVDDNYFLEEVLAKKTTLLANSILWNEVDQYIYSYICNTFNLLSDRYRSLMNNYNDISTACCVARQVVEITINAISNQWVITSAHNIIRKEFKKFSVDSYVSCKELHNFALSISVWPQKAIKTLSKILSEKYTILEEKYSNIKDFSPTAYQQFNITKFVAENFATLPEEQRKYLSEENIDLAKSVTNLQGYYRYLCKYVHPTSQLFPLQDGLYEFDQTDIATSVQATILLALNECMKLIEILFDNGMFIQLKFLDIIESKRFNFISDEMTLVDYSLDFVSDTMNNYKSIILNTTEGDLVVSKITGFSKKTNKFAKKYESLDDRTKEKVDAFINDLTTDK